MNKVNVQLFNVSWEVNGRIVQFFNIPKDRVHELKVHFDSQVEFLEAKNFTVYVHGIVDTVTYTEFTSKHRGRGIDVHKLERNLDYLTPLSELP